MGRSGVVEGAERVRQLKEGARRASCAASTLPVGEGTGSEERAEGGSVSLTSLCAHGNSMHLGRKHTRR